MTVAMMTRRRAPRSRSLPGIARHGDLELRVEYQLTVGELTLAKDVENFASRAP
jgi:hypothetical protein